MKYFMFSSLCSLLISSSLIAQIDSFYYHQTKYYSVRPDEWILVASSDSISQSGQLEYRHPVNTECSKAHISVSIENRFIDTKAIGRSRKYIGGFCDVRGFYCVKFTSVPATAKLKCNNKERVTGFIYRVTDSIDLVISLYCVATETEFENLSDKLINFAFIFFDLNGQCILNQKPYSKVDRFLDSITVRQNTFYIPYNTQWKVVHKSDSSISFSLGKSGDCLDPIITVSPPLHYSSSNIENGGTTNYLSFRKIFPDATMRNERIDVMIQRCASNNYDTLSYIIIRKEVICQHKEQDILYVAGILVRTKTGLEKVELILDTKGSDIVMSSYLKDQLDHFVGEILKGNNFNSWE